MCDGGESLPSLDLTCPFQIKGPRDQSWTWAPQLSYLLQLPLLFLALVFPANYRRRGLALGNNRSCHREGNSGEWGAKLILLSREGTGRAGKSPSG